MADNQEDRSREDLTEDASPYRLEEMREKGQVPQSRELTAVISVIATAVVAYTIAPKIGADLADYMKETFRTDLSARVDLGGTHILEGIIKKALTLSAMLALPICGAGFFFGVIGSLSQVGSIFSTDPLTPDFSKINPMSGLGRILSKKTLIDGIKMIAKAVTIVWVAYSILKKEILMSNLALGFDVETLFGSFASLAKMIFVSLIGIIVVFAAIDLFFTRREFDMSVKMTKEEAKQEHRQREGDPQIKARIRQIQRDVARKRMMQAVKKADVIITNPTHIAIALVYDRTAGSAPKVVAKGADLIAQQIKKVAGEAGVPLVENVPLARTLYKTVKVNQFIPRALYQAVAEVLAYVYRLKNRGL